MHGEFVYFESRQCLSRVSLVFAHSSGVNQHSDSSMEDSDSSMEAQEALVDLRTSICRPLPCMDTFALAVNSTVPSSGWITPVSEGRAILTEEGGGGVQWKLQHCCWHCPRILEERNHSNCTFIKQLPHYANMITSIRDLLLLQASQLRASLIVEQKTIQSLPLPQTLNRAQSSEAKSCSPAKLGFTSCIPSLADRE
jgi:hypothetical protein